MERWELHGGDVQAEAPGFHVGARGKVPSSVIGRRQQTQRGAGAGDHGTRVGGCQRSRRNTCSQRRPAAELSQP